MKKLFYITLGVLLMMFILPGISKGDDLEDCRCDQYDSEYNCIKCAEATEIDEVDITAERCPGGCCGIKLNTKFPIIGNCIETKAKETNATNAFPTMMGALTKIIMSVILVVCFIMIIVAGILWSANKPKDAKELLKKVAITILLLGFSGVILKLVNPNFFG